MRRPTHRAWFWAGLLLMRAAGALAQESADELEDEFAFLREDEVVYSASRHEQLISDSPATITVITRSEIVHTHCLDVVCLLRQVPELEIRRVGPMHHAVGARALANELGDKVLLLVDGRESNYESFGMPIWPLLSTHLEEIERIEVVRGPGSALYGANAHSLVVSITTRGIDANRAEVFLGAGEHAWSDLHLLVDRLLGDWRLRVRAASAAAGPWRDRGELEKDVVRVGARLERTWASSTSGLDVSLLQVNGNLHTLLAPLKIRNGYRGHAMIFHRAKWLRAHVWLNAMKADADFDLPLVFQGDRLGAIPTLQLFNTNLDAEIQLNWSPFEGNLLIGGTNYRWLSMTMEGNDPGLVHQHRVGVFLQDEQQLWDQLTLVAGVRFDVNSITPFTVSPRAAVVWRFVHNQSARLAFGRAFRKPSFFNTSLHLTNIEAEPAFPELSEFFHRSIGNAELDNESVTTLEAGYRGRFWEGRLTVESDVFLSLYRDTIGFLFDMSYQANGFPDLARSRFQFDNQGMEVDSVGGSIALVYSVDPWLRIGLNYTYRHSWYIADSASGLYGAGDRVPWEPAHLFNASCRVAFESGLRAGATVHARSSFDEPWPEDGGLFSREVMVHNPAALITSGFAAWRIELDRAWIEAGIRVSNVFHVGFRDLSTVTRFDGVNMGGMLMGRLAFLYLRAGI